MKITEQYEAYPYKKYLTHVDSYDKAIY